MSGFEDINMDVASHLSHLSPVLSASTEDRKRLRPSSPSSPAVSPALTKARTAGVMNFGPTLLEVMEEAEFSWTLPSWETAAFETPVFTIGGEPWKISYAVTQKQTHSGAFTIPSVSVYLVSADAEQRKMKNPHWGVCAEFILGLSNPKPQETLEALESLRASQPPTKPAPSPSLGNLFSPNRSGASLSAPMSTEFACSNCSFHRFCAEESDWGFSQFVTGDSLKHGSTERGFGPLCAPDGSIVLFAKVRVLRDPTGVLWHSFNNYNGKEVTGYVGLTNQGATCYMNSFLQSIFLTNAFRKAVYRIPTASCSPTDSIPLALQRVFYKLQTSRSAPSTTELTKSFGWDSAESFMQHDVQEFSRVLLEDLENKMKGSEVEGTVERLFRGKMRNVLRCTQVEYESVREESFYDLQLTIKGVPNLKESFERYVAAEMLCGDNQYRTDTFGLQDAKKFVEFEHFPPVLHVHLERYAFDMMAEATVKIHDRFEYPTEIDLSPYLSQNSPDRETPQVYWLHSVLVHAGDGHGGHYFSYIRHPSSEHRWYKFDDTKVTPCTEQQAVNENFGGNDSPFTSEEANELYRSTGIKPSRFRKYTSAYLLVYIRKADLNEILTPVSESDVPAYLVERIKADDEAEARRRQERQSMYLSSNVIMVTDPVMSGHRFGDLVDLEHPACQRRFAKEDSLASVRDYVVQSGYLGEVDQIESVEMYQLTARRNKTFRPDSLVLDADTKTLASLQNRISLYANAFYFRSVSSSASMEDNLWQVPLTPGQILISVKWFNEARELSPLGCMAVDPNSPISCIIASLKKRVQVPEQELFFYEELKPATIVLIDAENTFAAAKLRQGDIIIVTPVQNGPVEYFSDLTSWRSYDVAPVEIPNAKVCNQQRIDKARISIKWKLPELVHFIASELALDEARLRIAFTVADTPVKTFDLTSSSVSLDTSGRTVPMQFLKTKNPGTVADFLQGSSENDEIVIRYEVTPVPAVEAESMLRLVVQEGTGLGPETSALLPQVVYLPRYTATVSDLFAKLGLTEPTAFRLLECLDGRIRRTYVPKTATELLSKIDSDNALTCLYLEAAEKDSQGKLLLSCFTFERSTTRPYGIPFKFALLPDEPLKDLRTRLSQKLGSDCTNAALYICTAGRERLLEDESEVLAGIPALDDVDNLGIQLAEHKIQRSHSGFDGAIRIRRHDPEK